MRDTSGIQDGGDPGRLDGSCAQDPGSFGRTVHDRGRRAAVGRAAIQDEVDVVADLAGDRGGVAGFGLT